MGAWLVEVHFGGLLRYPASICCGLKQTLSIGSVSLEVIACHDPHEVSVDDHEQRNNFRDDRKESQVASGPKVTTVTVRKLVKFVT